MKNTFGNSISVTIYGESHGKSIGVIIDGLAAGIEVDEEFIKEVLSRRRPVGNISTSRQEADNFEIHSGVFNGRTTGTPLMILIPNADTRSNDYSDIAHLARPSHADFSANCRYNGYQDYRGGGHFSGRLTAAVCAAGAVLMSALNKKGIYVGTHIKSIADINDREFGDVEADIEKLSNMDFAVLDDFKVSQMIERITEAKAEGDSVGGVLETAIIGVPAGVGEPFFDSVESVLSHALFSIPAVKGVEFGAGFEIAKMKGSEANDPFYMQNGKVLTKTNNSGGINGGITNGMPIVFRIAIRPTPTISKVQQTVDFVRCENAELASRGRHDPCIVHRARIVADCITAIAISDLLVTRFGTDWLVS